MNFVSTGVKEVTRRLRRQRNRLALTNARRHVERAEAELGRVGWRELAGDTTVDPAFEVLRRLDEEVSTAEKHIASLEAQVQEQEAARAAARQEHQVLINELEEKRGPAQESLRVNMAVLSDRQKALHAHNIRRAALEAEQASLAKTIERAKRVTRLSDARRTERLKANTERFTVIPALLAEMDAIRPAMVEPMVTAEQEIKVLRLGIADLATETQAAKDALGTKEHEIALTIAGLLREIAATRRQATRVEEQKESPFLLIGRRLAERETAPASAQGEFKGAHRARHAYERIVAAEARLARESHDADRQDLRLFRFVVVTVAVLITLFVPLLLHKPIRREWLPSNTQAIVTLDVSSFTEADFTRALKTQEPDAWERVWTGLVQKVAEVPQIDVHKQVSRITHALAPAPDGGPPVDYLLVEMRLGVDVDNLLRRKLVPAGGFGSRLVSGLAIYEKENVAIAQIGPSTLALGSSNSVEDLIRVRLGLQEDLKSDATFFSEFQRLDSEKSFRLVTQRPTGLTYLTDPLLNRQILTDCRVLGLTLDLNEPVSAVFLIDTMSYPAVNRVARMLQANPDQVLQLQSAGPNLFIAPPVMQVRDQQIEWRFKMTSPAAREFLQRVTNLGLSGADRKVAKARTPSPAPGASTGGQ